MLGFKRSAAAQRALKKTKITAAFFLSVEKKEKLEHSTDDPATGDRRGEITENQNPKDWKRLFSQQKCWWMWDQMLWSTFHWYLRWRLLLVLSAPSLPVLPLLFGQSRRHADQTGDRLAWAKSRADYQRFSGTAGSMSVFFFFLFLIYNEKSHLTCSVDF